MLQSLIKLSDGSREKVFSRGVRNDAQIFLYTCNICAVKNLPGERVLQTHIQGRKHQAKLSLPYLDAAQFRAQLISRKPSRSSVLGRSSLYYLGNSFLVVWMLFNLPSLLKTFQKQQKMSCLSSTFSRFKTFQI